MENPSCGPGLPSWWCRRYFFFLPTFFFAFFLAAIYLTSVLVLVFADVLHAKAANENHFLRL
jgi:hypothetical protein